MKTNLNLKIVSTLVVLALNCQTAMALDSKQGTSTVAVDNSKVIELKNGIKVREMVNNKKASLYQIALISGINVDQLRKMNNGRFDKKDVIEEGELLVLPENSPLLPAISTSKAEDTKQSKYTNLPDLGSDENYDVQADKDKLATHVAYALQTLATQDWKQLLSSENGGLSSQLANRGKDYAEDYLRSSVKNHVVDPLRTAAQDFLGRFGTAQLSFDVSDKGQFSNVNVKLFSPWYDTENTLIFSQISFQEYEHKRRIGNIGIGQRWDFADKKWLLGYNVFLDHDFQRSHNRLGLGVEAWSDYMKLAANYYHPLSNWKQSRDFDDYLERAAKGFDVRFQGYLPQYPHLGGSLMYEQYFGDKVALFGKDNLQKNPRAVTASVDYTPVPLFTLKAEHKRGQNNQKATSASLTMNYRMGVPLKDQLDPDMVQAARSLAGSRYDLVDRNNYIVLEYKEKKLSVDLGLGSLQLVEGQSYDVSIAVYNAKGLSSVKWNGDMFEIDANGGFLCYTTGICTSSSWATPKADTQNWKIVAPSYVDENGKRHPIQSNGKYTLSVSVTDKKGRSATSNQVSFEVIPDPVMRKIGLWAVDRNGNKTTMASNSADGLSAITLIASLVKPKVPNGTISAIEDAVGFSDEQLMNRIPDSFDSVLKGWTATSNGKKITLIDGTSGQVTSCPKQEPCVIVKSFEKIKMGQKISAKAATAGGMDAIGDSYALDVASNIEGVVEFSTSIDQFGASFNKVSIDFAGGQAGLIKVYRSDGVLVATQAGNLLEFDPNGSKEWKVDNEYYVKAYAADGVTEMNSPYVIWSLVGSNAVACPNGAATAALPDASNKPNGPWFNVAMGYNAHYKIRSIKTGSYATSGSSIIANADAPQELNLDPINATPSACAGDQGFRLQVFVK
ncbi:MULTISPECIES: inverse autotransporter beta domain-containing protein [unclassified Gilliamella]|uniref:inverse autotransporter beta domain-containing protein n=1 Tax=unclassified Gilliamella TaxID=2685620 RepID=UPI00226A36EC|nr:MULTISPECIES: inverse autotransporter beta domain-containing protein [unclassified Gilliamella]MCX8573808.1 inverse autotransporter beta domain-containing protein [Gilliamella sp. B3831]MCX8576038.1 inverse autotransporter beta domain-containing protein [Gilliamella sp. B3815]MCX8590548.1 inverse autotransporter beta domain-containing protein [Gilliamella sp. B3812]MCX8603140.1 inverse autotransporter beta domain-containing protein [Gilliamella sp. B3823]MCX8605297.1 inverse autotransporter